MRRVHGKLNIRIDGGRPLGDQLTKSVLSVLHEGAAIGLKEMAPAIQQIPEKHRRLTRDFHQFTGNTVASYTAAVVKNTKVVEYFFSDSDAIHPLVQDGQRVYLEDPVEGRPRAVTGTTAFPSGADYGDILAEKEIDKKAASIPAAGIILTPGVDYARGMVDIWANTRAEVEHLSRSSAFGWHIKKGISKAANNFNK